MDWPLRLKVALGTARGLAYLHSSSNVGIPIVHRDFKSTNILLNSNFDAKVMINLRLYPELFRYVHSSDSSTDFLFLLRYLILGLPS